MSEGNGANSGIPNADSENVLDDLMQNNVQFDEDEKPKTVSFLLNQEAGLPPYIVYWQDRLHVLIRGRACVRILEPHVPNVSGIICKPCCFE